MADFLKITLDEKRTAFRPGEEIRGRAEWSLDAPPESVSAHLCWFTRGKGTEDFEAVAKKTLEPRAASGNTTFSFRAPDQPYSFSGQLISLIWAVELVADPGEQCERVEIVIGPDAAEIVLAGTVPNQIAAGLPAARVI